MKLHSIRFKNIHSLKGEHSVNFDEEPLSSAGIFAITGVTGSGKSTILDVIVLSLFNNIPRFDKKKITTTDIENKGSVVTHFTNEAWTEVVYSCKKGKYRSRWEISKTRNNTWRDYDMSITDLTTDQSLPLKKSDVPDKNIELIGLNYEQFIKSILLSQGEFARFLKAKKNERFQLLEDITGASIYRKIGEQAYVTFKEKREKLELERAKIDNIQFLTDEENQDIQNELEKLQDELSKKKVELENNTDRKRIIEQKNQIELEKASLIQKEKELDSLIDNSKTQRERFGLHNKLQPIESDLRIIEHAKQTLAQLKQEAAIHQKELENHQNQKEKALQNMSAMIGMNLSEETIISASSAFEKEIIKIDHELNFIKQKGAEVRSTISAEVATLPSELRQQLTEKISPAQALSLTKIRIEKLAIDNNTNLKYLQEEYQSKQEDFNILSRWEEINQKAKKLTNAQNELIREKAKVIKDLDHNKKQEIQKNEILKRLESELAELQKSYEHTIKSANLETLRSELEDEEPCPLCGSLQHPYRLHQSYAKIGEAGVELEKKKAERNHLKAKVENINTSIAVLKYKLNGYQPQIESLKTEIEEVSSEITDFKQSHKFLSQIDFESISLEKEKISNQGKELLKQINNYDEFQKLSSLTLVYQDLDNVLTKYKDAHQKRISKYQGIDIHEDISTIQKAYQNAESKLLRELAMLKKSKKDYAQTKNTVSKKIDSTLPLLKDLNIASIDEALEYLIPGSELAELQLLEKKIQKTKTEISTKKEEIKQKDHALHERGIPNMGIEEINSLIITAQNRIEHLNQTIGAYEERLRKDQENKEHHKTLSRDIETQRQENKKFELLNSLIGDAKGAKFSNYAQSLTLSRLLSIANSRLQGLSDRYLLDHDIEEDDLLVIDQYQGSSRRAISTLSGGETFIISLALALSLSDLASQNILLECLFIDEGFGTLDPETLDMALSTLEKLQYESGKTIGIISHVASLKERIVTQIKVKKGPKGYSTLDLTASPSL